MPLVTLQNCHALFAEHFHLNIDSLTMTSLQHTVVLGPNGSGKSALAAFVAGDFEQLIELYKTIIGHYKSWTDYIFKPHLLIHFVEKSDGGYTNSETKIMKMASEQAGSHFSWLCLDVYGPLSDKELRDLRKAL